MPGYIQKELQNYKHQHPSKPQYAPYPTTPSKYGASSQEPTPQDTSPPATKEEITHIQKIVGGILYYARSVDLTVLVALFAIATNQVKATKKTLRNVHQVLDYLVTNIDAMIILNASYMLLNIHSDASYLYANNVKRRSPGHLFLGSVPKEVETITLNGAIFTLYTILKCVALSSTEA